MAKKFHLGLFSSPPVMHHTVGGWKHPRNIRRGYRWDRPEVWQHCARLAEGAKFDFMRGRMAPSGARPSTGPEEIA